MRIESEIGGVAIVLLGSFNPAIFTPAWFERHGLLPPGAGNANLRIAHPEITAFDVGWLDLEVTRERLQARTFQGPDIRVHDLVLRLLTEQLPHMPVRAMGINLEVHFRLNAGQLNRLTRALAPVDLCSAAEVGSQDEPRMISLTMHKPVATTPPIAQHQINVTVGPSERLQDAYSSGVCVRVNDHYALDGEGAGSATRLGDLLVGNYEDSLQNGKSLAERVISLSET